MSLPSEEQWRPVPGYEGRYDVSDQGRVRSWINSRGNRREMPTALRSSALRSSGRRYPQVCLALQGVKTSRQVHVLVAKAFLGPRPNGAQIRHLNGDREDPRLANLAYGTPEENQQDSVRHGTHANASKTHCPSGHEYTPENTYIRRDFYARMCRACLRARGH